MNTQAVDPWATAENPPERTNEYYGQVQIDTYFATLQKGVGKVPFDPAQHDASKRVTAIDILIIPLAEHNAQFEIKRSMIAESGEWGKTVLPSIKALGISPRELNGKYVHVQIAPTGETYTNAQGEVKNKTSFKFLALYQGEAECRAAYNGNAPANGNGAASSDPARETALKFLAVVVENAVRGQSDLNVIRATIAANIANMPMINKFFTVDSVETIDLINKGMSK